MWHHQRPSDALPNHLISNIDQVCTVVSDFDGTIKALTEKLGIGPFKCWELKSPELFNRTFRAEPAEWSMKLGVAMIGRTQWEVIQPAGGRSLYDEHLARAGSGVHHLLLETAQHGYDKSLEQLSLRGLPVAQSAMLNIKLQVAGLTLPAAPRSVAEPLSTHFAYVDAHEPLATTLELARFPPGISRPLGIRIGKADYFAPAGETNVASRLPNSLFEKVAKIGFVVRDLDASVAASPGGPSCAAWARGTSSTSTSAVWARCGSGRARGPSGRASRGRSSGRCCSSWCSPSPATRRTNRSSPATARAFTTSA
jgi:hypothetical protein